MNLSRLAKDLKPYIAPWISAALNGGGSGGGGGAVIGAHALDGAFHTGALASSQATQFPLLAGGRTYTGNLVLAAGILVDGIDISEHAANAEAHHALATAGNTGISLSGQAVSLALAATSGLQISSGLMLADGVAGNGLTIASKVLAVGAGNGISVAADSVAVNQAYAFAWTAAHTHAGNVTFTGAARTITSDGGYNLTLGAAGDLVLDPTGNVLLPNAQEVRTVDFTDTPTGIAGIRLWDRGSNYRQLTMGAAKFDELYARVFVADEVRIDRGEEYWSKSFGIVETDFQLNSYGEVTTVWFEDAPGLLGADLFSENDYLLVRTINWATGIVIQKVWFVVGTKQAQDSVNHRQQWFIYRVFGGETAGVIKKGSLALDVGQSGQGWVHLSALEQDGGPFIQIGDWTGPNPYEPVYTTNRVRMGNLNGVGGIATDTWGFAAAKNLGTAIGSGFEGIVIDPVNGVRLYNATLKIYDGGTQTIWFDTTEGITLLANATGLAGPYNLAGIALWDPLRSYSFWNGTTRFATLGGSQYTTPTPDEWGVSLDVIAPGSSERAALQLSVASTGATVTGTNPILFLEHSGSVNQATLAANAVKLRGREQYLIADEGLDLVVYLYADEGDDNVDRWRLWIDDLGASAPRLRWQTYATGSWVTKVQFDTDGVSVPQYHGFTGSYVRALDADGLNITDDAGNVAIDVLDGGYITAKATTLSAYDANGLALKDDGGNLGLVVADGGLVGIARAATLEVLAVGVNGFGYSTPILIANGNYAAALKASTNNGTNVWTSGARKDATGGSAGTDRWNLLYDSTMLQSVATNGDAWFVGNVSVLSLTDRTPGYEGDALAELAGVRAKGGKLDHSTLPAFARATVNGEPGRDLGAMISLLTVAVQQLAGRMDKLEAKN